MNRAVSLAPSLPNLAPLRPCSTWSSRASGRGRRISVGLADFITYYRIGEKAYQLRELGREGASAAEGERTSRDPPSISSCSSCWIWRMGSGGVGAAACVEGRVWSGTRVPGPRARPRQPARPEGLTSLPARKSVGGRIPPAHFSTFRRIPSPPSMIRYSLSPGRERQERQSLDTCPSDNGANVPASRRVPRIDFRGLPRRSEMRGRRRRDGRVATG